MVYGLLANNNGWLTWVLIGVVAVLLIGGLFFSSRRNKQSRKEYIEQLDAIAPGNKVKTAGGICGVVVEVCDDNTVIIETGSEQSGKSYIKMDKELIAQTDAKGASQIAREEAEARRKAEKAEKAAQKHGGAAEEPSSENGEAAEEPAPVAAEEPVSAQEEAPLAEVPAEEGTGEEIPAEVPETKKAKKAKKK